MKYKAVHYIRIKFILYKVKTKQEIKRQNTSYIEKRRTHINRALVSDTDQRSRLAADRAEMIIMVKYNLHALDYDY